MSTEAGDTHTCTDKDGTSVQINEYVAFIIFILICIYIYIIYICIYILYAFFQIIKDTLTSKNILVLDSNKVQPPMDCLPEIKKKIQKTWGTLKIATKTKICNLVFHFNFN